MNETSDIAPPDVPRTPDEQVIEWTLVTLPRLLA
jgi:hypothetical protein